MPASRSWRTGTGPSKVAHRCTWCTASLADARGWRPGSRPTTVSMPACPDTATRSPSSKHSPRAGRRAPGTAMTSGIITLFGGIGLFLLRMRLMTDGLTASAGGGLRTILAGATRSRRRALASGLLITTGVQSSSAVIFATIGFVNAGLLSLGQAIGLVYGANLGTTLTSWLVAVAGFNLNLRALALPAIGLGGMAWAISRTS